MTVGAAALVGAPSFGRWSGTVIDRVRGSLASLVPAETAAQAAPEAPALTTTAPVASGRPLRRPAGESALSRLADVRTGSAASSIGTAATAPSTRSGRSSRKPSGAPVPVRAPGPAVRHDQPEPLAAIPLGHAAAGHLVPPPVAVSAAVPAVAPAAALEVTKVDVRPGIVKRVDARGSKPPAGNPEMVVLRVLVSAEGSPATVQVLRGSKVDPSSDEAAVAAVRQWAFSPALKHGRPVDCWFNVAVPVEGSAQ